MFLQTGPPGLIQSLLCVTNRSAETAKHLRAAHFALLQNHLLCGCVLSAQSIPSDLHGVAAHKHSVTPGMDGGALIMAPGHRNFRHFQPEAVGQVKNLCVKAPASDALAGKDEIRGFTGKRFEAALRIAIGKAQQQTQVEVKSPRHDPALKRLALELKC